MKKLLIAVMMCVSLGVQANESATSEDTLNYLSSEKALQTCDQITAEAELFLAMSSATIAEVNKGVPPILVNAVRLRLKGLRLMNSSLVEMYETVQCDVVYALYSDRLSKEL